MSTLTATGEIRVLPLLLIVVLAGLVLAVVVYAKSCPCERMPGLWVSGEPVVEPVTDWSFANDVGLCEVQVSGVLPHAVTLNCMADEQRLFLSCSNCDGKIWSGYAVNNPLGWIKIGDSRFPVLIERVQEAAQLDKAWTARLRKLSMLRGSENSRQPRPAHWWSFELTSRVP